MSSNRSQPVTTVMSSSLASGRTGGPAARQETASERHSLPSYTVHTTVNAVHSQTFPEADMARRQQAAVEDAGSRPLWFIAPAGDENRRRSLTREHVVTEALTVISTDGVEALSMRALATRLGVVPGALYRHVRNKEQLHDLVLDGALLAALHQAGLPERDTGLAFALVYDYTLGFALSSPTCVNEQRVQDTATRNKLHAFLRSLPAESFPTLVALGEHVWLNNRDERFTAGLDTLVAGIDTAPRPRRRRGGRQPQR